MQVSHCPDIMLHASSAKRTVSNRFIYRCLRQPLGEVTALHLINRKQLVTVPTPLAIAR